MVKIFRLLFLGILLNLSLNAVALESVDVMDVSILKVYKKNILVLNRGAEDGIFKKDHIKLTSSNGFIARGICLKSTMLTSHWKIYRVVRPELMSMDLTYKLRSINQSGLPKDLKRFARVDFSKSLSDYGDKNRKKQVKLQQERIVKYDLPEGVKAADSFKRREKGPVENFIEKNFSKEDAYRDFNFAFAEFYASPIKIQSRNDQKETQYGLSIKNFGRKYRYALTAEEKQID